MAIRRSPKFRFDYFLRSLPVDVLGRRCEHLMRAAVKEVEDLEKKAREAAGLPTVAEEGKELPPIKLLPYKEMKRMEREMKRREMDKERSQLEQSVEELEVKMKEIQMHHCAQHANQVFQNGTVRNISKITSNS